MSWHRRLFYGPTGSSPRSWHRYLFYVTPVPYHDINTSFMGRQSHIFIGGVFSWDKIDPRGDFTPMKCYQVAGYGTAIVPSPKSWHQHLFYGTPVPGFYRRCLFLGQNRSSRRFHSHEMLSSGWIWDRHSSQSQIMASTPLLWDASPINHAKATIRGTGTAARMLSHLSYRRGVAALIA